MPDDLEHALDNYGRRHVEILVRLARGEDHHAPHAGPPDAASASFNTPVPGMLAALDACNRLCIKQPVLQNPVVIWLTIARLQSTGLGSAAGRRWRKISSSRARRPGRPGS